MNKESRGIMRIAICDDEQQVTKEFEMLLKDEGEDMVLSIYHDPLLFLKDKNVYDAVFLDIDMPQMNGIEVGNYLRKEHTQTAIIYVTNLSEYRPMAFGVHAFDYIEKPMNKEKLKKILNDLKTYQKPNIVMPTIAFKSKEGILRLPIADILYFEFLNRKVYLHTTQKTYALVSTLYSIKDAMKAYHFESPHKSFCINLDHVRLVKGYDIFMSNDIVIPLSQKRSSEFRAALNHYLSKCLHGGSSL